MSRSAPAPTADTIVPPGPHTTRTLRVERRVAECDDTVALDLVDPHGADLPDWTPGAHVDVVIGGEAVRQYSLCGDPADRGRYRLGILREPDGRGGSRHLHDEVDVGSLLEVGAPRNNFELVDAEHHLLLGGGIGITPLLPMARVLRRRGAGPDRVRLLHLTRSATRRPFAEEVLELGGELHHDDVAGPLALDALLGSLPPGTAVYCCGPEGLLSAVERHRAVDGTLHVERFSPRPVEVDVGADGPFEVLLRSTGATVQVAEGQSVLDAVSRAGADVGSSCREGTCGTCETGVVEGDVDHRDSLLTDDERAASETMMICVSRARCPRLVLDL